MCDLNEKTVGSSANLSSGWVRVLARGFKSHLRCADSVPHLWTDFWVQGSPWADPIQVYCQGRFLALGCGIRAL